MGSTIGCPECPICPKASSNPCFSLFIMVLWIGITAVVGVVCAFLLACGCYKWGVRRGIPRGIEKEKRRQSEMQNFSNQHALNTLILASSRKFPPITELENGADVGTVVAEPSPGLRLLNDNTPRPMVMPPHSPRIMAPQQQTPLYNTPTLQNVTTIPIQRYRRQQSGESYII